MNLCRMSSNGEPYPPRADYRLSANRHPGWGALRKGHHKVGFRIPGPPAALRCPTRAWNLCLQ